MSSEKKETPQDRYHKAHTVSIAIRLMKNTEQDIISKLNSVQNKAGYIKNLIRADIVAEQALTFNGLGWTKAAPGSMPEDLQRVIATVEYSDGYRETLANCRWNKSLNRWEWESNAGTATWGSLIGTVTHWMCMPTPADD